MQLADAKKIVAHAAAKDNESQLSYSAGEVCIALATLMLEADKRLDLALGERIHSAPSPSDG